MRIECTHRDSVTIVAVSGELDVATAPVLQRRMQNLIEEGKVRFVFDFTNLTHITSSGLSVLAFCYKMVQPKGGSIAVAAARGMVEEVIGVWAGNSPGFVRTYPDVEQAVEAITKES